MPFAGDAATRSVRLKWAALIRRGRLVQWYGIAATGSARIAGPTVQRRYVNPLRVASAAPRGQSAPQIETARAAALRVP